MLFELFSLLYEFNWNIVFFRFFEMNVILFKLSVCVMLCCFFLERNFLYIYKVIMCKVNLEFTCSIVGLIYVLCVEGVWIINIFIKYFVLC